MCVSVCFQLVPVVQNTLSYDASSSVPEPTLHKDDLDSILGDVSHSQLHIRITRCECCNNSYRHMTAADFMCSTQLEMRSK